MGQYPIICQTVVFFKFEEDNPPLEILESFSAMRKIPGVSEISYGTNFARGSDFTFALIIRFENKEVRLKHYINHKLHKNVANLLIKHFQAMNPSPQDAILCVNLETEFAYKKPFGD